MSGYQYALAKPLPVPVISTDSHLRHGPHATRAIRQWTFGNDRNFAASIRRVNVDASQPSIPH